MKAINHIDSLMFYKKMNKSLDKEPKTTKKRKIRPIVFPCILCIIISLACLTVLRYAPREMEQPIIIAERDILKEQLSMLTKTQRKRLDEIMTAVVTKKQIEIVISKYEEDVSWSHMYSMIATIYDKSNKSNNSQTQELNGSIIKLPNVGRESFTYLHHILQNYNESLADLTIFCHGSAPIHGYDGHRRGGGHLISNSSFHDFVLTQSKQGRFVFSGAVYLPTLAHVLRWGYNKQKNTRPQGFSRCPSPPLYDPKGSEYKFDLDDPPHIQVLRHIASLCRNETADHCSGISFWEKFIKLPLPPFNIALFSQGAIFAVRKEQIKRRPYEEYKLIYDEVSKWEDPSAGFFLEWMWFYLLTSPHYSSKSKNDSSNVYSTHHGWFGRNHGQKVNDRESIPYSNLRKPEKKENIQIDFDDKYNCELLGNEFNWAMERPLYKTLDIIDREAFTKHIQPREIKKI